MLHACAQEEGAGMIVSARLPENLARKPKGDWRNCVKAMHDSGDLFRLHMAIATRLHAYAVEADRHGTLYSAGVAMSDNLLYLLLRADAGGVLPGLPPALLRKIIAISLAHVRKQAALLCEGDERVPVVISEEDA